MRNSKVRVRSSIGIFEKYCASATTPSPPFSSQQLQPSVWVLTTIVSSVLPGSTAQRLSVGVSGFVGASTTIVADSPDDAAFLSLWPVDLVTQRAGTVEGAPV